MDETKDPKDTSQIEDPSAGTKGTSTDTKTYTVESEKKAVDDALSKAGRDAKSISDKATEAERILTDAKTTRDSIKAEREQWQKDRDEAELEAVRDDHDALKSLQERQRQRSEATKLATEKAELAEKETKHQETVTGDLEQIRVFKRTQLAAEVAVAKGVDLDSILKLTTEDSREAMEATANLLTKGTTPLKTDSSTTIGGSASWEEVRAAYIKNPNNQAVYERYREMRKQIDAEK